MRHGLTRREFLVATGASTAAAAVPRGARAQEPRTLVVAWDSDIDTLDPASFKTNGGYVTVANTCDIAVNWKVRPVEGRPGLFRSRPAEYDGTLAESWTEEIGRAHV